MRLTTASNESRRIAAKRRARVFMVLSPYVMLMSQFLVGAREFFHFMLSRVPPLVYIRSGAKNGGMHKARAERFLKMTQIAGLLLLIGVCSQQAYSGSRGSCGDASCDWSPVPGVPEGFAGPDSISEGNTGQVVQTLNEKGYELLKKARWGDAIKELEKALEVADQHPGSVGVTAVRTLDLLAYAYLYLDKYDEAQRYLDNALRLLRAHSNGTESTYAETYYVLGLNYRRQGSSDSALVYLSRSLALRRAGSTRDTAALVTALLEVGKLNADLGSYAVAEGQLGEALGLLKQQKNEQSFESASCYHYLAIVFSGQADVEAAKKCEERALEISRKLYADRHPSISAAIISLGDLCLAQGDYERAKEHYQEALKLTHSLGSGYERTIAWVEEKLARVEDESGRPDHAIIEQKEALAALQEKLGELHPDVASAHRQLGLLFLSMRDHHGSLSQLDSALWIYRQLRKGNEVEIAQLNAEIACNLLLESNRKVAAIESAVGGLEQFGGKKPVAAANGYRRLGDACSKEDPERALSFYESALKILCPADTNTDILAKPSIRSFLNGKELLETLIAKAQSLDAIHKSHRGNTMYLEASLRTYEKAGELVGSMRNICRSESSKLTLGTHAVEIYENGMRESLELYRKSGSSEYLKAALWFSDANKAGVLLEGIAGARARELAKIPQDWLNEERNLADGVALLERHILEEGHGEREEKSNSLKTLLFAKHRQMDSLRTLMQGRFPELAVSRQGKSGIDLAAIQDALDETTAIVEYFCGSRLITVFVIQKNHIRVSSTPIPKNFRNLVHTYLWALRTADSKHFMSSSAALYATLIRPVERYIQNVRHLVIVPDDILSSIPFEALVPSDSEEANLDYGKAPYLVRSHEISYSFSSAYHLWESRRKSQETESPHETFVGFAPVFSDSTGNGYFASSTNGKPRLDAAQLRSVTVDGRRLAELPYSRLEVSRIAEEFQRRGEPSVAYLNRTATKEAFEREAADAQFVHVATHGVVSEDHPELSALLFSQPADTTKMDEGTLYSNEIYNLHTNADLVVLSSCESGVGRLVRGEGMMTMTRGFFQAGAKNVVVSLWKVVDESTSTLMYRFYQFILKGYSYPKALRAAKLSMLKDHLTAAPAMWASFILIGN